MDAAGLQRQKSPSKVPAPFDELCCSARRRRCCRIDARNPEDDVVNLKTLCHLFSLENDEHHQRTPHLPPPPARAPDALDQSDLPQRAVDERPARLQRPPNAVSGARFGLRRAACHGRRQALGGRTGGGDAQRLRHAGHKAVAPANATAQTAIRGRKGGCWEDEGYEWCTGI